MIPELGHFAAVLALVMALVQSVFPLVGAHQAAGTGWRSRVPRPLPSSCFCWCPSAASCTPL
ncbi:hypothetical protein Y695_02319 [Hydrogenophaga sp. T4]|nr:hypothetical protein Y695_02319 [Hydrogenophaga sp. T4]